MNTFQSYQSLYNETTFNVDQFQTNQIYVADGSATNPSIAFILDPSTGIFRQSNGTLSITSSGIETLRINNGLVNIYTTLKGIDVSLSGTLTAVNVDGTTMIITGNITAGGLIEIADGSANNPSLTFSSDNSTGLYKFAALTLGIASNGVSVCKFNFSAIQMFVPLTLGSNSIGCGPIASGNMSINTTADATIPLKVRYNGSAGVGTELLRIVTNVAPRFQFFDEIVSSSLGCFLLFNTGNPSQIRCAGNLQFWLNSATTSSLTLSSTNVTLPLSTINGILSVNSSHNIVSNVLTNGQLLIGSTSNAPVATTLTGTNHQINITNGAGSITLSTPQNIDTTSTPQFGNLGINTAPDSIMALKSQITGSDATGLQLASFGTSVKQKIQFFDENGFSSPYINFNTSNNGSICSTSNLNLCAGGTTAQLTVLPTDVVISQPLFTSTISSFPFGVTFGTVSCTAITSSGTFSNGTNSMTTGSITSGSINAGTNSISCGSEVIGSTSFINTGFNKLQLFGTDSSGSGPHTQAFTSIDNYPLFQQLNYTHNNISLNFDMYFDGSWRSSYSSSNFNILKASNQLQFNYGSGVTAGNTLSYTKCAYFDTNGSWNLPTQPCVQYSASTYISVSSSTVTTFNGFDTQVINQGSGITVTSNSTFTVSIAGIYQAFVEMQYDTSSSGVVSMWINKNGSSSSKWGAVMNAPAVTDNTRLSTSICLSLAVNDYLQVYLFQSSGGNLHIGSVQPTSYTSRFTLIKVA